MKSQIVVLAIVVAVVLAASSAQADVFNTGGTRDPTTGTWTGMASLEFVTVGDPGNAVDTMVMTTDGTTGYGSVAYVYQMGKYDVTAAQYCQFLNAVAKTDTYGLYLWKMASPGSAGYSGCGIIQNGSSGNYTYSVLPDHGVPGQPDYANYANFPVNFVSWGDAARFCNWLQNGQPTGTEGPGTTETGAYTLNGAVSAAALMAITRNVGASYFLPSEDEWYKATYYRGGGANAGYWLYPTQNNTVPSNILSSTGTNNANFDDYLRTGYHTDTDPTNHLTPVGAFSASPGHYGTYDQGGDVWQWNDANISGSSRGVRGGCWGSYSNILAASIRYYGNPAYDSVGVGFRVASVPEPGSLAMLAGIAVTGLLYWWRKTVQCEHWNSAQGIRSESSGQSFLSGLSKGTFIGVSRRERLVKSIFSGLLILGVMQLVLTGSPNFARGEVLLDTMQGDQFTNQTTPAYYIHNFSIDDKRVAVRFTIPDDGDYRLSPVELLVAARISTTEKLAVTLYKDAPTFPGAILDAVTLTNLPLRPDGTGELTLPITSVAFDHAPDLLAGESYYVALSAPTVGNWTDVYWLTNRNNLRGPLASLSSPLNGTDWRVSENALLPRLTVQAVRVPEPGSLALLGIGAISLLAYAWRRRTTS